MKETVLLDSFETIIFSFCFICYFFCRDNRMVLDVCDSSCSCKTKMQSYIDFRIMAIMSLYMPWLIISWNIFHKRDKYIRNISYLSYFLWFNFYLKKLKWGHNSANDYQILTSVCDVMLSINQNKCQQITYAMNSFFWNPCKQGCSWN